MENLQDLSNLGRTSVMWLHAAGIHSKAELRRRGAVGAWLAVKARGLRVSRVLLYALEGALQGCDWRELPLERKAELLSQLATAQMKVTRS